MPCNLWYLFETLFSAIQSNQS